MKIAIIIAAAGMSRRFQPGHKLLAMLDNKPVLQHTLEQAVATGMDVLVVARPDDREIHAVVKQATLVLCASHGLGDSIAVGVTAAANYDGWLIALGDMPLLKTASYLAVGQALLTSPVVRSEVDGKPGHPVGFHKEFYPALVALTGDSGARALLGSQAVTLVRLSDPGCLLDVDTPLALDALNILRL
ncbi:nucleotidyltransferase family protein [Pantoea rodasii]|uniref:nucleotidyltransferase family protein n=1 Tax=Pantoea rodasii TaxID=1076549 RepID=UPI00068FE515|nr:nucleotidyltransferase family protein [Pantoea rodasii]